MNSIASRARQALGLAISAGGLAALLSHGGSLLS
jgi:hypothetical protein